MTWRGLDESTSTASDAYGAVILEAIESGEFEHEWIPVDMGDGLEILVSRDALRIDGARVNGSAQLQEQIADMLGAVLLTPLISDETWRQADRQLTPSPQQITASIRGMLEHSQRVSDQIGDGNVGLIADPGKDWVQVPNGIANYGWHQPPSGKPIQSVYTGHGLRHSDYSQILRFVSREATQSGEPVDVAELYRAGDPRLTGARIPFEPAPLPSKAPRRSASNRAGLVLAALVAIGVLYSTIR